MKIEEPKRWWTRAALVVASGMALVGSFASCAETTEAMSADDPRESVPDASSTDAVAADADAGAAVDCKEEDPDCTTEVVSCDDVAWCVVPTPLDILHTFTAIWGSGPNDVWAVGEHGTLLHYDGKSWRLSSGAFPPGKRPHLYSVWGSGPSDVWAVGGDTVLRLTR